MSKTSVLVMLNLFQHPFLRSHRQSIDAPWTLKRVQGDEVGVAA
ncbi:hypothetical protein [Parasphingorhabdus sp.]